MEADRRGGRQVVLIRFGEIALKGGNRRHFEEALARNLARAVAPLGGWAVRRLYGRLVLEPGDEAAAPAQAAAEAAARVFGVVAAVPAWRTALDLEAIHAAARHLVASCLGDGADGRPEGGPLTFKVAARRSNHRFELDSMELNRRVGAELLRTYGPRLKVDVHRPHLVVHVEVRDQESFVYGDGVPGPGGLPVGVSGRALALISGGIDSPVAAWMGMKRGLHVDAVHFHAIPFTSHQARDKVVRLGQVLAGWHGPLKIYMVPFAETQKAIYSRTPHPLGVILMRRMMLRMAQRLADRDGYQALLTGESLGQVASQTLQSMAVVQQATQRLILRPLVGWDKEEIVRRARSIGTYAISVEPYEDCCTLFVARHPATHPTLEAVLQAERALDVDGLAAEAVAGVEVVECGHAPAPVATPIPSTP